MVGASATGLAVAVAHHLFYRSLDGEAVPSTLIGTYLTTQEFNLGIGTTFAFLFRSCMVFAVGLAFIQAFWNAVQSRNIARAPSLQRIDTLYSATRSMWSILNGNAWTAQPLLMVIASRAWLVPIASIVTPTTLSIQSALLTDTRSVDRRVPNLNLASLQFSNTIEIDSLDGRYYFGYNGPTWDVSNIVAAVVPTGNILPLPVTTGNDSWTLLFAGPALDCSYQDSQQYGVLRDNIGWAHDSGFYPLVGWIPAITLKGSFDAANLPFVPGSYQTYPTFKSAQFVDVPQHMPATNLTIPTALGFYFAVLPNDTYPVTTNPKQNSGSSPMSGGMVVLLCELRNTTYSMSVHNADGYQVVAASHESTTTGERVPATSYLMYDQPANSAHSNISDAWKDSEESSE